MLCDDEYLNIDYEDNFGFDDASMSDEDFLESYCADSKEDLFEIIKIHLSSYNRISDKDAMLEKILRSNVVELKVKIDVVSESKILFDIDLLQDK